jgi:hypothetical protein
LQCLEWYKIYSDAFREIGCNAKIQAYKLQRSKYMSLKDVKILFSDFKFINYSDSVRFAQEYLGSKEEERSSKGHLRYGQYFGGRRVQTCAKHLFSA